jgi:8-oxo-dGTP diphosphatase
LTTVVAAVIEQNDRILVAQRRSGGAHGLKWEFPGGKVDAGETPEAALARELEEELAIQALIGPEILRYEYAYSGKPPILLIFFRVTDFSGEPLNRVFERVAWAAKQDLSNYDFLEGDAEIVKLLGQ